MCRSPLLEEKAKSEKVEIVVRISMDEISQGLLTFIT